MPLLLPRPKLLAPTPVSLASPPGQVLPNAGVQWRCRGFVLLHCHNAEPATHSVTKGGSSLLSCQPGRSSVMLKFCGVLSWQGSSLRKEPAIAPVPVSSQRLEWCSWTQLYTSSPHKLNILLLVNMALPNPSLPSSQVPFWSLSRATGAGHTHVPAGRHPGQQLPVRHPHNIFTTQRRQCNSRLHPLPSRGKRDVSSLLSVQKEDVDPKMALASTCHFGLICDRARMVCQGG